MIVGAPLMAVADARHAAAHHAGGVAARVRRGQRAGRAGRRTTRCCSSPGCVTALATATFWVVAAVVTVSVVGRAPARPRAGRAAGRADRRQRARRPARHVRRPAVGLAGDVLGGRGRWPRSGSSACCRRVPRRRRGRPPGRCWPRELAVFRRGRLWLALGTTALYQAGAVGVFSYVAPLLTDVAGLDGRWVPVVLLGSGWRRLAGSHRRRPARRRAPVGDALRRARRGRGRCFVVLAPRSRRCRRSPWCSVVLLGVVAFLVAAPLNARVFAARRGRADAGQRGQHRRVQRRQHARPALGGLAITAGSATPRRVVGLALVAGSIALAWPGIGGTGHRWTAAGSPCSDRVAATCACGHGRGRQDRGHADAAGWGGGPQLLVRRGTAARGRESRGPPAGRAARPLIDDRLGEQRRGGARLDQVDGTTCGSAVLVALAAWADPAETRRLDGESGAVAAGGRRRPASRPGSAPATTPARSRCTASPRGSGRRRWAPRRGGWWRWLREHAAGGRAVPGAAGRRHLPGGRRPPRSPRCGAALAAGRPVPLLVGGVRARATTAWR